MLHYIYKFGSKINIPGGKMRKRIAVLLCFVMLFACIVPSLYAAKMSKAQIKAYYQKLCKKAKADAEQEVGGFIWMGAGCLLTWVGLLGAYFIETAPPAERLIGKPAYYTKQYTQCYTQAAKDIQTGNAWTGFFIGLGLSVVLIILWMTVFTATVTSAIP